MKVDPIGQYILDGQGNLVLESDLRRWSEWCSSDGGMDRRRVAEIYIPYGEGDIHVSTVFLGSPHPMIDSDDWALFETMVFGADEIISRLSELAEQSTQSIMGAFLKAMGGQDIPEIQRRYVTRAEALQGHAQMVQFVEVAVTKLTGEQHE